MKKIIFVIFCIAAISSCGRKDGIHYEGERKIPDFTNVYDE